MSDRGTLEVFAGELAFTLQPLDAAFKTPGAVRDLLEILGWDFSEVPAALSVLREPIEQIVAIAENGVPEDVASFLLSIHSIYVAINALQTVAELPEDFRNEIPRQLADYLLVEYFLEQQPKWGYLLLTLGIIRLEDRPAENNRPEYVRRIFAYEKISQLLTNPVELIKSNCQWGESGFANGHLIFNLSDLSIAWEVNAREEMLDAETFAQLNEGALQPEETSRSALRLNITEDSLNPSAFGIGVDIFLLPETSAAKPGLALLPFASAEFEEEIQLSERFSLAINSNVDLVGGVGILIRPGQDLRFLEGLASGTPSTASGGFGAEFVFESEEPTLLFGKPTASRLQLGAFKAGLNIDSRAGEFELKTTIGLDDLLFVLPADELGDILKEFLRDGFTIPFSFAVAWSSATGLTFAGGAGLVVSVFPNVTLGPIHVAELKLAARGSSEAGRSPALTVDVGLALDGSLGPVDLVVTDIGLRLAMVFGDTEAGPVDLEVGFKPPSGFGLAVDAGPISGGGFVQREVGPPERYAGALALKLTRFSINAFGVFERTSSGRLSFAVVMGIRFTPGFQLGFGFVLTGVGGIFGLNRRADVDALKAQLAKGTAGNVLFSDDPIKNAPTLLGDLRSLFPAEQGIHIVGPTVQITWLTIARFDLGIIIELPGPSKILIIGVARIEVGGKEGVPSLIQIRCDVFGLIDLTKNLVTFDATLINSSLLQVFKLTGDAAFRLSTGSDPYAMLTVGGFHPAFNPEPAVFSSLERITLAYDKGGLWLRLESYLAITSNTLQHGAKFEVGIEAGSLSADGMLSYDALIQFVPFYFTIDLKARVRVRWHGRTFASVSFSGNLSGPGPIVLRGEFCLSFFFFSVCFDDSFTLGKAVTQAVTGVPSLVPVVAKEFAVTANLEVSGEDKQVAMATGAAATSPVVVITPLGDLIWTQKKVPLNVAVERFEGVPLRDRTAQAVVVTVAGNGTTDSAAEDWFSPGTFINLSESEALNRSAFQREEAGRRISFDLERSGTVQKSVSTDTYRLPETAIPITFEFDKVFAAALLDAVKERRERPRIFPKAAKIGVKAESWGVYSAQGTPAVTSVKQTDAHQQARYQKGTTALPTADVDAGVVLGGLQ